MTGPATNVATRSERRQLWEAAERACEGAARLPDYDAAVYLIWGSLWWPESEPPVEPLEAYRRAAQIFEAGIPRATFAGERLRLQCALAIALTGYGRLATEAADRAACLQRAADLGGFYRHRAARDADLQPLRRYPQFLRLPGESGR